LLEGPIELETISFHKAEQQVLECQWLACLKAGEMAKDEEIWLRHSTVAQEWAQEAYKEDKKRSLLEEY